MISPLSPYIIVNVIAGAIACVIGWYVWNRRTVPGGVYFSIMMAMLAGWTFLNAFGAAASGPGLVLLFFKLSYIGIVSIPPLWLLFALAYGRRHRWLSPARISLLFIAPAIILGLIATNEYHELMWTGMTTAASTGGIELTYEYGIGFVLHAIYSYTLMLAGTALLFKELADSGEKHRVSTAILLTCLFVPFAGNIIDTAGLNPLDVVDLTPVAFIVTGLVFAWGIFRRHLFDIVPVARKTLIMDMSHGVLVLDERGRIVDMNPAAGRMLDTPLSSIGQPAEAVMARWDGLAERCCGNADELSEVPIDSAGRTLWLDVRVSALCDSRGRSNGRLVALWDISKRKQAEEELKRSNESLQDEIAERLLIEEKLQGSNCLLQAEVNERRRAEANLAVSLNEKELLLKEIHHRVKNNLQIVSSLLSLQILNTTNEEAGIIIRESQNRVKSMALIHEKLYGSSDLAHVDFRGYVQGLIVHLARSYVPGPGLNFEVAIEHISLDIDMAIPCGLIINELVSNSLKYAFKDGSAGKIRVAMSCDGDRYRLVASDDGAGLPPGIDYRNTSSLGLQLVVTLAGQLGGTIEHPGGAGTTFVIIFPKK